ncbi:MAG: PIN domain-containing protein [Steroidobacteraceae bacterium]
MIILDTNVLSALMQTSPDVVVVDWLDQQPAESIWITGITLFEAHLAIALLAKGKRQRALVAALDSLLSEELENRVLDFDTSAALEAAALAAARQRHGHPVDVRATQIAGIALARKAHRHRQRPSLRGRGSADCRSLDQALETRGRNHVSSAASLLP